MLKRTMISATLLVLAAASTAPAQSHTDAEAASMLQSLRRSVENVSDLNQIVERFKRFIDSNPGTAAAAEAKKDLAIWQDRLAKKMVKVGAKWVSPEERQQLVKQGAAAAMSAIDLIHAGRMRDADAALKLALDADPANITALYLRGVLSYRQDQLPAARKSFEALNAIIDGHAPTLNNLAVILSRQNAVGPALNYMTQALEAAPLHRELLNNAAEMLHAISDAERKTAVAQKLARTFNDQDAHLAEIMARQGQYRWGATWVDKSTFDRLQAAQKDVDDKVAKLQEQIDAVSVRATQIDGEIGSKQRSMSEIQSQSTVIDTDGKVRYLPLPSYYYELQADIGRLQSERASLGPKVQSIKDQIAKTKQALPTPQFTGVVHIVDVEGTPVPPENIIANPTTVPASQPTSKPAVPSSAPFISVIISGAATQPTTQPTTLPTTQPVTQPTNRQSN